MSLSRSRTPQGSAISAASHLGHFFRSLLDCRELPIRYGVAAFAVFVSALLRWTLDPVLHDHGLLLFFSFGVVVAGLYGGVGPGIAATFLSVLVSDYLFVPPRHTLFLWDPTATLVMMAVFAAIGIAISLIIGRLKRATAELRQSASALRKREFQLSTLSATVPEILFTATTDGTTDYINKRIVDYSGMTAETLLGSGWINLVHPDDRQGVLETWLRCVQTQGEFEKAYRLRRADGTYRWFQCHALPVRDPHLQKVSWFGVCADIHEHKILQDSLAERAKELQQSNEELQRFAHIAGHDLKEPLRTIGIFTQLLFREAQGKLSRESKLYADHILEGVERMNNLIEDLLIYATAGQPGVMPRERTDLNAVLGSATALLQGATAAAGATITCDQLPSVMANEIGMVRVLQNLIGNAVKYRSSLKLFVHISAEERPDEWVVSVRDNGIGFDMADAERIFGAFQRLHSNREIKGTGLGLAIVRRIIERHGGRAWVESKSGGGSTFFFSLPKGTGEECPNTFRHPATLGATASHARATGTCRLAFEHVFRKLALLLFRSPYYARSTSCDTWFIVVRPDLAHNRSSRLPNTLNRAWRTSEG